MTGRGDRGGEAGTGADGGRAPVVVVGLGPVGATAALLVARAGVPVVAIERDAAVYPHPRAVALDDDALRVLQAAGIRDGDGLDLLPGGTVRIRGRGGRPLVALGPPPTTTGHPGLAFFRQPQLERTLRERLEAEPLVDLRLGTTVLGVPTPGGDQHEAVLRVRRPDGTEDDLRAAWVLACDGGRSPIRTALGIRLRGTTSPSRWLVVDTDAPGGGPGAPTADVSFAVDDFEFGADPRGPWVHGPLPEGAHRWEFLLAASTDASRIADPAVVRALLARRLAGRPVPAVHRAAVYAFHARVAGRWRVGRMLLLGDAAHLAPPFAGQGLCAGLRDAGNVAWKVAAAWHGTAGAALLDTYAAERRPHLLRTTALAVALGVVVELRRPRAAALRDIVLRRVATTRAIRRWIDRGGWRPPGTLRRGVVATGRRYRHRAGESLPQPLVPRPGGGAPVDRPTPPAPPVPHPPGDEPVDRPWPPGAKESPARREPRRDVVPLDDVLPVGWVLIADAPDRIEAGPRDPGDADALHPITCVNVADAGLRRWIGPATAALVRPDRVVFGTASAADVPGLLEAAGRWTAAGRPRPSSDHRSRSTMDGGQ